MKKLFFLAASIALSAILFANNPEPNNSKVLKAFNDIFKTATNPVWVKTSEGHRVSFTKANTAYQVTFTETGAIKLISRIISTEQLPVPILEKLRTEFDFENVLSAHEYAYAGSSSFYLITIRRKKNNLLLKFFSDGEFEKVKSIKQAN